MKTALMIQNYPAARDRIQFMFPQWEKSGMDLFGVDTEDGDCFWPKPIPTKKIGINAYIEAQHLPQKLVGCVNWFIGDSIFDGYTHLCIIENDTLIIKPPPYQEVVVASHLAGGRLPPMLASRFWHNPWWMSRVSCHMFCDEANRLLAKGSNELGNPDFFFGLVWETIGIDPFNMPDTYSENHIFHKEQVERAKASIDKGAWAVHGVKDRNVFRLLLR